MPVFSRDRKEASVADIKLERGKMSQTGKRSQKVGDLVGHCKDLSFYFEMGSLRFNRITIAMMLRRVFKETRQK